MKKFVMGVVVGALITISGTVFAEDGLQKIEAYLRPTLPITLNGASVTLENAPVMYDGSTYLRLRDVSKLTGVGVNWNDTTQTVELSTYGTTTTTTAAPSAMSNTTVGGTVVPATTSDQPTKAQQIDKLNKDIDSAKGNIGMLKAIINGAKWSLEHSTNPNDDYKKSIDQQVSQTQQEIQDNQQRLDAMQAQLQQLQSQP